MNNSNNISPEDYQALVAIVQRAPMSRFEAVGVVFVLDRIAAILFPPQEATAHADNPET